MYRYDIEKFLGDGWYYIENDATERWVWSRKEAGLNFSANHNGFSLVLSGCSVIPFKVAVYYKDNQIYTLLYFGKDHFFLGDGNHLNPDGSNAFSKVLSQAIEKILVRAFTRPMDAL